MKRYTPIERRQYHSERKKRLLGKFPRSDKEINQLNESTGFLIGWGVGGLEGDLFSQKGILKGKRAAEELNKEFNNRIQRNKDKRK